ncbi:hypothetical protein C1645_822375 [Glomus cerebriforme]|uniref:Uncharacterized protein n=1 Tax=Glomus cerebriforme TaxID=658196 RepID=A0A397T4X9_9GLOM|nr:hypothetical protein C1645_822375 [Glomus cerebriforme]
MPTDLYTKIYNFLLNAEEEDITAGSVIYQGIEDNPWIPQNELKSVIEQAVAFVRNQYERGSSRHTTLLEILPEFEIGFKTVCSLRNIGAVKMNGKRPLTSNKIEKNIKALKGKLRKNTSQLYQHLFLGVSAVSVSELTWKDPLANQVITDDSDLVQTLPERQRESFMKPVEDMVPSSLPQIIWEKCEEFVVNFAESNMSILPQKLSHNGKWKESDEELADVTLRILGSLNDSWNNPAFSSEFAKSQNEGTYVTNVIVPAIRATPKGLPLRRSSYVSSAERQSSASANRKGEGRAGRRPDIMFVMKHNGKKYELIYVESSRLSCTLQKEKDDEIKLWRETNDGMYWVHKSSGPDKDEFGIIGMQVAGQTIRLNVLIRDMENVHRYYHLYKAEIPVQQSDPSIVTNFLDPRETKTVQT